MPNLTDSTTISWTETSGDLTGEVAGGTLGDSVSILGDDTTGTSVTAAGTSLVSQGLWLVYVGSVNLTVEAFVNAAWRTVFTGAGVAFVPSDGSNVRIANAGGAAESFYARRVRV